MELASAISEYLEIFHKHKRRHSALGMLTPIEFEKIRIYPPERHEVKRADSTKPRLHQSLP